MHKIKNALLALLALTSLTTGFLTLSPSLPTAQAAICYAKTGPFRVNPNLAICPAPGGGTEYRDFSGNIVSNPQALPDDRCFVRALQPSGTPGRIYNEQRCSDLEFLRNAVRSELCTGSGGTPSQVPDNNSPSRYSVACTCPTGRTLGADFRCGGSSTDSPSADTAEPAFTKNDCNEDNNNDGSNIDQADCGITRYIVIAINVLSALVAVVITGSIIAGGIQYTAAGSDPQKISAAKDRIKWALISLFIFIFGYSFLNFLIPGGVL